MEIGAYHFLRGLSEKCRTSRAPVRLDGSALQILRSLLKTGVLYQDAGQYRAGDFRLRFTAPTAVMVTA